MSNEFEKGTETDAACDPSLTRAQFIKKLVERASIAGALALVPTIVDSFFAPPAIAQSTGNNGTFSLKANLPPIA